MKKMILVAAFAAVATVFPAAPSYAQSVLTVDDDGVQCTNAGFDSIQDAVNAAAAGDEIRVCAGEYNETVDVPATKPDLRLVGPVADPTGTACRQAGAPDPTTHAIIENPDATATVRLGADGVRFSRFTVRGNTSGSGILTNATHSGYQVRQNRVQNNVLGIYFNSDGSSLSDVEQNCIRENNSAGAATGNGVYSDQGLENADIESNALFDQNTSGITLTGAVADVDDVRVRANDSTEDDSLVALFETSNVTVTRNTARANTGSAIFVGPDNTELGITSNNVTGAARGLRANASDFAGPPSTDVTIVGNVITGSTDTHGISAATNSLTQSLLSGNITRNNAGDGISLALGNGDNRLVGNAAIGDVGLDCRDDTTGKGTAGTDNTWINNVGSKADPPDICI
ncbi:right-handed parallel beta-helix repeat-containing protein [Streptomyces albidus (ex Kaewkla and Franco 2022)]|uniref:right-handed parallel beta-helix repeat-containing protein n=1 Tax=Streptomyces albidus (ex Kaewkla and Franco 2022) TaxID=722709 RepID=UPI0015EFD944|nr:right-handed parallel beta-helix repeat-containing protein [Streptomyces albidus (ex Kaewkla and Franco 2022)]